MEKSVILQQITQSVASFKTNFGCTDADMHTCTEHVAMGDPENLFLLLISVTNWKVLFKKFSLKTTVM